MSKQYYECHITMEGDREKIEQAVNEIGWKFSAIDGDPVMGKGVKCYATIHYNNKVPVAIVINRVALTARALRKQSINVTREKVELVIYDTRSKFVVPA